MPENYKTPSEVFLEIFCNQGGVPAASGYQCTCGQFWLGIAHTFDNVPKGTKFMDADGIGIVDFKDVVWVEGCHCKVEKWLVNEEIWLLQKGPLIGEYFKLTQERLQKRLEELQSIANLPNVNKSSVAGDTKESED